MKEKQRKKKSFKYQLIISFCLISIVPIVVMNIISYYNIITIVQNNVDELMEINLAQTKKNINTVLDSYEDLLYQMYTDDHIVELVDKIDNNREVAVSRNQLRRTLRGLANVKPYVQCITVITDTGEIVFYDKLATSTTNIKWMENYGVSSEELYQTIGSTNKTEFLSTKYAADFNSKSYYLFHMAHRIIDYKRINKKNGVIILSIDERMLNEVCNQNSVEHNEEIPNNLNIIVDENGNVVSFLDPSKLGMKVINPSIAKEQQNLAYIDMVKDTGMLTGKFMKAYRTYDEELHWYIINVSDQSHRMAQITNQQKLTIFVIILSVLILVIIIIFVTNHLIRSIGQIVKAMQRVEQGELSIQVQIDKRMPIEIESIANQFNHMIMELNDSIQKEKEATEKQRNAEISALEAQINPHFLYNTLDTINWMAINKDQYEISNSINSLAKILRYGVNKSNSIVEIKEEVEWIKQYVFLQQTRLKNTLECLLHVDPNVQKYHIHKLLLQPFVENAILHGFDGVKKKHMLEITIGESMEGIHIVITDNGKGMNEEIVQQLNQGFYKGNKEKNHIGTQNAIDRLHMYYGEQGKVRIESVLGEGTNIYINIPKL